MGQTLPTVRGITALWFLLSGAAVAAADTPKPKTPGDNLPDAVQVAVDEAIKKVYPALVRIHVVGVSYSGGKEEKHEGSGSGAIISPDGYVITNHHVAGRVKRIRCTLANREEVEATLVGTDPLADIAVIKLHLDGRDRTKSLPVAGFGDSDSLRVGDRVLAMGCPLALSQSVTLGIVSNVQMTFPHLFWPQTFRLDGEDVGSLVVWIGHDARISPGNSGGPLVNLKGEIVGINEIGFGLGGAIPGNLARDVANELIRTGEVKRSWLGLTVQPLLKSRKTDEGVLIGGVIAGSPAEKAGIKPGDILLSYQGIPLKIRFAEQLPEFNRLELGTPIGTAVAIVYERDGEKHRATAVTVARGHALGHEAELKKWGITVRELTLLAAKELKREPHSGVLVTSVREGGPAHEAKPRLEYNDIILEVGGKPVHSVHELVTVSADLTRDKAGPVPTLVGFERKKQRLLTVVKLSERETPDRSPEASKAWLAVSTQVLNPDLAEALGLKDKKGVRITQVHPDTTASKAGLKVGDIVLRIDEDPIEASQPDQDEEVFPEMVRKYRVGAKVKLDVVRDGKPIVVEAELAPSPRSTRELSEYRNTQFEFQTRDLTFQDRVQRELARSQKGALVTGVDSGGWAALAHLAVGDIILSVDGHGVEKTADLSEQMKRITHDKPERVVFFVRRGVHTLFLELEPAWSAGGAAGIGRR
jgi:serine protease Do